MYHGSMNLYLLSCDYCNNPRDNPDVADCLICSVPRCRYIMWWSRFHDDRVRFGRVTKIMNWRIHRLESTLHYAAWIWIWVTKNILKKNWALLSLIYTVFKMYKMPVYWTQVCRTWNSQWRATKHTFTSSSELELPISNRPRSQRPRIEKQACSTRLVLNVVWTILPFMPVYIWLLIKN